MVNRLSNDVLLQYGQVSLSQSEQTWTQPTLSSNGTLGSSTFAVSAQHKTSTSYDAWHAFDNNTNTYWCTNSYASSTFTFFSTTALKVTKIVAKCSGTSYLIGSCTVQGSSNNSSWTTITNSISTSSATQTITLTNTSFYKYYRLTLTANPYLAITQFNITAKYQTSVANSIIYPLSFSDTNYGCCFSYVGAGSPSAYVSSKTTSGLTLKSVDSSSSSASWIAIGY